MPEPRNPKRPWQLRFGLTSLMLVTSVFCVMGAAGYHLLRAHGLAIVGSHAAPPITFILFTVAAPMLLLTALSLGHQLLGWLRHLSGRKKH